MSDKATIAALTKRIERLEAEGEIRKTINRYMEICDTLSPDSPMDELAALFTDDASWGGKGARYDKAFGGHVGRGAITEFLKGYCDPPHFTMNAHFLTSEVIQVDGDHADATWLMLQTPTFRNGESFLMSARLEVRFARREDRWLIQDFRTSNIFGRKMVGDWNDDLDVPTPDNI